MTDHEHSALSTEVFDPLTNELRVRIIVALAEHQYEHHDDRALPFNELRERVGGPDSGQFNYHLDQLQDRFVWEGEEGYALTLAGERVVGAILAGTYATDERRGPVELDAEDPLTGGRLAVEWASGFLVVRGAEEPVRDEGFLYREAVPPGILTDRSFGEALEVTVYLSNIRYSLLTAGVCPLCYGPVTRVVEVAASTGRSYHQFRGNCTRCGHWKRGPVGVCLLLHPVVVSFFQDHGTDIRTEPYWKLEFLADDEHVERVSEDPLEVRVGLERDGDRLQVRVDDTGQVVGWSRPASDTD